MIRQAVAVLPIGRRRTPDDRLKGWAGAHNFTLLEVMTEAGVYERRKLFKGLFVTISDVVISGPRLIAIDQAARARVLTLPQQDTAGLARLDQVSVGSDT